MKTFNCLNCGKENEVSHRTSNKYCNNTCQAEYQSKQKVEKWLSEGNWECKNKQLTPWIKRYIISRDNNCCSVCGISEWNGKPLSLEIDHIDGSYKNNNESNLRCICPNCHSQTDTYKAKNTGNGRTLK